MDGGERRKEEGGGRKEELSDLFDSSDSTRHPKPGARNQKPIQRWHTHMSTGFGANSLLPSSFFLSSRPCHRFFRNRLVAGECEEHAFLVKRGAGNREHGLILERGGLPPLWKAGASSRTPQTGRSPSSVSPPPPSPDCASHQTRIRLAYPCH